MKDFLKRYGLWLLFATAVVAVALAALSVFSITSSPLTNLVQSVTSPFRAAYTAAAAWFNDKQNYYEDTTALKAENAELKNQIAEMEAQVRQAQDSLEENARYRTLLNLRPQERGLELEAATITQRSTSNWTSSLTLNRGMDHGVEKGDCVITESEYLVGIVSDVGANWCTVLNLVDTDTSLGAQVFRTKAIGVAEGDFALMERQRLKLTYLPAGTKLLSGDLVETSGLGGYYPSGLVIGTVEEVKTDDSGAMEYAILRPSAAFDSLTQVFIIKSFDIVD